MSDKTRVHLLMPKEIKDKIQRLADSHGRTFTAQLIIMVKQYWEK